MFRDTYTFPSAAALNVADYLATDTIAPSYSCTALRASRQRFADFKDQILIKGIALSPAAVLCLSHLLSVVWINAIPLETEMVKLLIWRHLAMLLLVCVTMDVLSIAVNAGSSVSAVQRPLPNPAQGLISTILGFVPGWSNWTPVLVTCYVLVRYVFMPPLASICIAWVVSLLSAPTLAIATWYSALHTLHPLSRCSSSLEASSSRGAFFFPRSIPEVT